jgi:hypothetical protein
MAPEAIAWSAVSLLGTKLSPRTAGSSYDRGIPGGAIIHKQCGSYAARQRHGSTPGGPS